jgi:hypothetical protein
VISERGINESSEFPEAKWIEYTQVAVAAAGLGWLLSIDGQLVRRSVLVLCYFQWDSPVRQAFHPKNPRSFDE